MGLGGFPGSHPLWVGMPGMHGIAAATYAFQDADLILAVGVRFDERVLSTVMSEWAPNAKIIHIDVDPAEISKNRSAHIGIAAESAAALDNLADAYARLPKKHDSAARATWMAKINAWKVEHPYHIADDREFIQPQHVIQALYKLTGGNAIVSHRRRPASDVRGPALPVRPAAPVADLRRPRDDGLRPAVGDRRAGRAAGPPGDRHRRRRLVRDDLQELSTAEMYGLPVKVIILNNGYLGMVRQWQELFYESRLLGDELRPVPARLRQGGRTHGACRGCRSIGWRTSRRA